MRRSAREIQSGPIKLEAPKFYGKQSISTYKKQFEADASAGTWTEEEKATAPVIAHRDDAF